MQALGVFERTSRTRSLSWSQRSEFLNPLLDLKKSASNINTSWKSTVGYSDEYEVIVEDYVSVLSTALPFESSDQPACHGFSSMAATVSDPRALTKKLRTLVGF